MKKKSSKEQAELQEVELDWIESRSSSSEMFSAASFFNVIEAESEARSSTLGEGSSIPAKPAVIAFYGFKGGAGRTMALANCAHILARRGHRIAVVDFDFEAPGLHVVLGQEVESGKGAANLIHEAKAQNGGEKLDVLNHCIPIPISEGTGKIFLLPAGKIDEQYLAQIEEMDVPHWHGYDKSPVSKIIQAFNDIQVDAIFIDCRTGFNAVSSHVLFHLSHLSIVFFPISEQVWDGISVFLDAASKAKNIRDNYPNLLFMPSMVVPDESGKKKLEGYLSKLRVLYSDKIAGKISPIPLSDDATAINKEPWISEGIIYNSFVAIEGKVQAQFQQGGAWSIYAPLANRISEMLDFSTPISLTEQSHIDNVLGELDLSSSILFGEELNIQQITDILVPSENVKAALDVSTNLVVGAKGSGKSLLWSYLTSNIRTGIISLPAKYEFLVGHPPKVALDVTSKSLTADGFKELESNSQMKRRETYKAFWILYALARVFERKPESFESIVKDLDKREKAFWQSILQSKGAFNFSFLLQIESIGSKCEKWIKEVDAFLRKTETHYVLVYDGLDIGFQIGQSTNSKWIERRNSYVAALLQVLSEFRQLLSRVHFKVLLREDIYLSLELQNRSHLEAFKQELRFRSTDLWKLALNLVSRSGSYKQLIRIKVPGLEPPWMVEEEVLETALEPLWGKTIEKGKAAYTTNYILKRTSDSQERFFPRTFAQVLIKALEFEKQSSNRVGSERVLHHKALEAGIEEASRKRVEDLQGEYLELKPYLQALKNVQAIGSHEEFVKHIKANIAKKNTGIHMGPQGYKKVIDLLHNVGVLGKIKPEGKKEKWAVSFLYRAGLNAKFTGLK